MINLIPIEKKKKILLNTYLRIFRMIFFVLSFSVFVASIVFLPAYVFSVVKKNLSNQRLEEQKKEEMPKLDKETVAVLNDVNSKLDILDKVKNTKTNITNDVLREIISKKAGGIKITRIFFENDTTKGRRIEVNGIAKSREQLLLFRDSFEDSKRFKSVDLPISNFVKGSNIQFYLTLIPS